MNKEDLMLFKENLNKLNSDEKTKRDLYLRLLAIGKIQGPSVGVPSVDKPWLKYYDEEKINAAWSKLSVFDYLKEQNKNNLEKTAINCMGMKVTYGELIKNIEDTAKSLISIGVKKGDILTIMLPAIPEEVYLFYANDIIGSCINYVSPEMPMDKLVDLTNELNSKKLIIFDQLMKDENYIYNNTNIQNIIKVGSNYTGNKHKENSKTLYLDEICKENSDVVLPKNSKNPEEIFFIAKTGGTTDKPKNVMLNDRSFNVIVHQYINSSLDCNVGDKWLRMWPIFSATAAVSSSHLPLCMGMELILKPFMNINEFDEVILNDRPNHIPLVPAFLEILINSKILKDQDLSFLRTVGCGGVGMTEEFEKKTMKFFEEHNVKSFLGCGYGLTENASVATIRMSKETTKIGSAGIPMVNTNIGIFDPETLEEKKYGEMGEICISSQSFMMGYYNNKNLTDSIIKKHSDGSLWLHSKDLGYIDNDGFLFVKNRIKRIIFTFPSDKVYPSDLEEIIEQIDGVEKVSVIGQPDLEHDGFLAPAAFIVVAKEFDPSKVIENIYKKCQEYLPKYAQLKNIYLKDNLPLTEIGKTNITELEKEAIKILSKKK